MRSSLALLLSWPLVLAAGGALADGARGTTTSSQSGGGSPELGAEAEAPETERLNAYALLGFATNPDAAALFAGVERRVTYSPGSTVLLRELHHQVGAELMVSGLIRPAVHAEWLPLKILKLRLQYEVWIWPGFALGRGHGLVFPDARSPFDPDELERRRGEELPGLGHRLAFMPTLQLKVWRVVVLDNFELAGWWVNGPRSYWREPLHDNLILRGALDGTYKNLALLLLELWSGGPEERILAGGLHEVVHSLSAGITRHRLGVAVIASPFSSLLGIDRPTLFFLFGANTSDENREDELWMNLGIRLDLDVETRVR